MVCCSRIQCPVSKMPYHRDRAIVLRKTDYSNTSIVLNVLTQEMGRLGLIAKGIRRGGPAFEAEPELFTIQDAVFTLRRGGGLGILSEAAVIDDMRGIRGKVDRYWAACYVAELLLDFVPEAQPLPDVYALAAATLRAVAGAEEVALHVFMFEVALLRLLGHEPMVSACAECGAQRKRAREVAFSALKGGCLCDGCRGAGANAMTIRGSTAALLGALGRRAREPGGLTSGVLQAERLKIGREAAKDLRRALDHFFTFLREKPSKTLKYVQALYR